MTEAVFVQQNSATWKALEQALRMPGTSFREIDLRMSLYRTVSGHLSYARTEFPGSTLCDYLGKLTAEAHAAIYAHTAKRRDAGNLISALPRVLCDNMHFILASTALFLVATILSFAVSMVRPEYTNAFLPASMKGITADDLNMDQSDLEKDDRSAAIMSNSIMVNNIRVSVLAFGLGLSWGLGTVWVLLVNGFLLGALASIPTAHGNALFFWSLILPHGVWELTAICISGGAGLRIGYSLIRPGPYRRVDALVTAARSALGLMAIVVALLCVAAVIEGFFTPLPIAPEIKLIFAAITAVPLIVFLVWALRPARGDAP